MRQLTLLLALGSAFLMADGAALYTKCATCHGALGEKPALGKSAPIGGQDTTITLEALKGYKEGTLNRYGMGAVMKGQVAALDESQMQAIAEYIATLK
jgi:cytochrome c